jgi:hypothetical protein
MKADRARKLPWHRLPAGAVVAGTAVLLVACAPQISKIRSRNAQTLTRLEVGMTRDQVLDLMGREMVRVKVTTSDDPYEFELADIPHPYRTESYEAAGSRFEVLYYLTSETSRDRAITDDELTPIVLIDGRVDGWGWGFWNDQVRRYEIRVR